MTDEELIVLRAAVSWYDLPNEKSRRRLERSIRRLIRAYEHEAGIISKPPMKTAKLFAVKDLDPLPWWKQRLLEKGDIKA